MSLKVCLVGCGGMAVDGHGPSFRKIARENSHIQLAACCDVDARRAEEFRKTFGFARSYTDMAEMLRIEKPDAVSLIVPVPLTEKMSIQVMEMGIPVILEKPPGMNREQTLRMMDVAARTGTIHQVAFNRRYMPMVQKFKEWRQGCQPHLWQYDFFRSGRKDQDFSTTSIHAIDTVRFLAGQDYKTVEIEYLPNPAGEEYVPSILLSARFRDGQRAKITFVPASGMSAERCIMHGANETITGNFAYHGVGSVDGNGSIVLTRGNQVVLAETASKEEEDFVSNGFYGENLHFLKCVQKGVRPVGDIASGLQAVEIADCIRHRKAYVTL